MTRLVAAILVTLALAGCRGPGGTPIIPPEDILSDAARAELRLPVGPEMTPGNPADGAYVAKLDPLVVRRVEKFLKPYVRKSEIVAARPVGNHLLLWVWFPEIADGGIELIYSIEKKKVVGTFYGGIRG